MDGRGDDWAGRRGRAPPHRPSCRCHATNGSRKCDELVKKGLSAICRFRLKRHVATCRVAAEPASARSSRTRRIPSRIMASVSGGGICGIMAALPIPSRGVCRPASRRVRPRSSVPLPRCIARTRRTRCLRPLSRAGRRHAPARAARTAGAETHRAAGQPERRRRAVQHADLRVPRMRHRLAPVRSGQRVVRLLGAPLAAPSVGLR